MSLAPSAYGAWLTSARQSIGWSSDRLAATAGLPLTVIDQIETGRIQAPNKSTRAKIETAINAGAIAAQRRAAGEAVVETETLVRASESVEKFNHDATLLTLQGWEIVTQSESRPARGCLFFFVKPKITRTVTYRRTLTSGEGAPLVQS